MKRKSQFFLKDILEAIGDIETFVINMNYQEFSLDKKTSAAVVHKLEIIGEATKNLPRSIRLRGPDVPWQEMAGMRDKIAHFYFGVDYEIVWNVVKQQLPHLRPILQRMLNDLEGGSSVQSPPES